MVRALYVTRTARRSRQTDQKTPIEIPVIICDFLPKERPDIGFKIESITPPKNEPISKKVRYSFEKY